MDRCGGRNSVEELNQVQSLPDNTKRFSVSYYRRVDKKSGSLVRTMIWVLGVASFTRFPNSA